MEEDQIVVALVLHLALVLTARSFYNQNQPLIHGHGDLVPLPVIDRARVNYLQYFP